jgi:hypothetical protein
MKNKILIELEIPIKSESSICRNNERRNGIAKRSFKRVMSKANAQQEFS